MTTLLPLAGRRPALPAAVRPRRPLLVRLPLLCLLALQAVLSWRLQNSAFQDESLYLYAGHREIALLLHGTPTYDNYASYFSGAPFFYPVLGAMADRFAGLAGARALSLLFMLACTVLLHGLARRLFGRRAALMGAALFALSGPVLFLGHLATYDAMALFLLAVGAWTAVRAARLPWPVTALVGVPLALAGTAKYAALLFAGTVLGLVALAALPERGLRQALLRGLLALGSAVGCAALVLLLAGHSFLAGVRSTTTARQAGTDSTPLLLRLSAEYGGLVLLLAVVGTVLLVRAGTGRQRTARLLLAGLLTGTALLAPAYQVHLHTLTSLHKHIGFGLFFAAPVAGYGLARIADVGHYSPRRLGIALGVCLLATELGISQSAALFRQWPDSTRLEQVLRTQIRPQTGHYLVEEAEVPRYYQAALAQPYQWSGTYFFAYTDKKGEHLTGVPAYRAALTEDYFDLVVLRYGPTAGLDRQIDSALTTGHGYTLIATVAADSSYGRGTWFVWRPNRD
ncbi:ArnT family glycosyltransferase [Streptacidiphilus sp. N1-12]|uniref:ArnT family glycosyltransferase n=2 Tax=Streptacidiphilus alkalitolerans TaxID=3342712 RepID=A0ABV6WIC9_9ACTN